MAFDNKSTQAGVVLCLSSVKNKNCEVSKRSLNGNLRKQPTFRDATTGFSAKRRLRSERRRSRATFEIWLVFLIGRAAWEICLNQSEALPRFG